MGALDRLLLSIKRRMIVLFLFIALIFLFDFVTTVNWGNVVDEDNSIDVTPIVSYWKDTGDEITDEEERPGRFELAKRVHYYINQKRFERGLSKMDWNPILARIARGHSDYLATISKVTHDGPGGENMSDRYQEERFDCEINHDGKIYSGAENALRTYWKEDMQTDNGEAHFDTMDELAKGIANQWMNSSGHRENIVKPFWREEGIGITYSGEHTVYAVQNFC